MASLELTVHGIQPHLVEMEKVSKKLKREAGDDTRRDEWSNDAIMSLLDLYEAKWKHRSRGNLKGGDWEDVATCVSIRGGGPKTPFQCKNKVASMKQKYRSEALLKGINGSDTSRWPFFDRMDVMLRMPSTSIPGYNFQQLGLQVADGVPAHDAESGDCDPAQDVMDLRASALFNGISFPKFDPGAAADGGGVHVPNRESNQEDASNTLPQRKLSGENVESETSTPRSNVAVRNHGLRKLHLSREIAASIRSFAESLLRLEKAKLDLLKDAERRRSELEARRLETELKRTEIVMSTQLEIAKLLSLSLPARKRKAAAKGSAAAAAETTIPSRNGMLNPVHQDCMCNAGGLVQMHAGALCTTNGVMSYPAGAVAKPSLPCTN